MPCATQPRRSSPFHYLLWRSPPSPRSGNIWQVFPVGQSAVPVHSFTQTPPGFFPRMRAVPGPHFTTPWAAAVVAWAQPKMLAGKRVLITGGGSGAGENLALGFAAARDLGGDPGDAIAVIGGGQLARMMAQPAIALGLPLRLLAEAEGVSAAQVIVDHTVGRILDQRTVADPVDVAQHNPSHAQSLAWTYDDASTICIKPHDVQRRAGRNTEPAALPDGEVVMAAVAADRPA